MREIPESLVVNGPTSIKGRVELQGSKNSALSLIPTLLLSKGESVLRNVPDVVDIRHMISYLYTLGINVFFFNNEIHIEVESFFKKQSSRKDDSVRRIRSTYYFIPYLLKRFGKAKIPNPGGCRLGARKSDFLFEALKRFGTSVYAKEKGVEIVTEKLQGIQYALPYPSQLVSTVLLSMAAIASGTSVLRNLSLNPEIGNKINLLRAMGADIEQPEPRIVVIRGGKELRPVVSDVISDRIVAATWIAAAGITGGWIEMSDEAEPFMQTELEVFKQLGLVRRPVAHGKMRYFFEGEPLPVSITTGAYPMFSTDIQPLAVVLITCRGAVGSEVREMVFDQRFNYVPYLNQMGTDIEIRSLEGQVCPSGKPAHIASISTRGRNKLQGRTVTATDLRAGMALVLAAMRAQGRSVIQDAFQIFRGYENVVEILNCLGGHVEVKPC